MKVSTNNNLSNQHTGINITQKENLFEFLNITLQKL